MIAAAKASFSSAWGIFTTQRYTLSVSLPTWDEIVRYMKGDENIHGTLQSDYPRFYQHAIVSKLNDAVLARVKAPSSMRCVIFPSKDGLKRCSQYLRKNTDIEYPIQEVEFCLPQNVSEENARWGQFFAVLFPEKSKQHAEEFWGFLGDGISSRHADFCLERFPFMSSVSVDSSLQTAATYDDIGKLPDVPWDHCDSKTKEKIRKLIAKWATSEKPGQEPVDPQDVFLYPKGMCAIGTLTRSLVPASSASSEAVVFGWPYGSTPKCIKGSGYERFTFYDQGTSEELDLLEASLKSGHLISCLFCEVPSNPLCATPDLQRIRRLADQYNFVVACDETIGTFINVDVMPYVDVVVTSLTKIFSGACNVMGGSLILNTQSSFYGQLQAKLGSIYEDLIYPLEAQVLLRNCIDFPARVQKASRSGMAVANFLKSHGSISKVNYPTMVDTTPLYEQYRRPNGGYGSLISIVFRNPESAVRFYDAIDLCKGPSFGANFTLVLPYSQLAHAYELDWAESKGMAKHIVRISVGLEEERSLIMKFDQALKVVEEFES
ncbi:uncharacterized protein GIQ15_04652 [Arthroderma uncinatum]|uniref:uncharacterized protein n=1 Tax=Arthroderma uncinatum TaxID=74035 RepID=UPI00144AD3E8|nr:uncharacterized protein GIQ15_04652 [Arthroderma uncinatum]KAF3481893.1 hypothetical protein GIQ15_04652 [Arthroderma uncinatum]